MQINPLSNNSYYNPGISGKNSDPKESKENKLKDKFELSEEAKNIQKNQGDSTNLANIKKRINSNFYNSSDVINKVAENILKDIKTK